jgi:hypothetical protein
VACFIICPVAPDLSGGTEHSHQNPSPDVQPQAKNRTRNPPHEYKACDRRYRYLTPYRRRKRDDCRRRMGSPATSRTVLRPGTDKTHRDPREAPVRKHNILALYRPSVKRLFRTPATAGAHSASLCAAYANSTEQSHS